MSMVIAARKNLLKPEIQDDEQVPAAHLLQLQLGETSLAVGPTHRDYVVGVAADNRFERHLDREIEMRRDQRLNSLNHFATVTLKCIGDVVIAESEDHADEIVDDAIEEQFVLRIVDDLAASHKTGSEYTFKSFLNFAIVAD